MSATSKTQTFNLSTGDNKVLVPQGMANTVLFRLKNQMVVARLANKHYKEVFARELMGQYITIKKPYYGFVSKGRVLTDAQIAKMVDETVTMEVSTRAKGALEFNDEERTFYIDSFEKRYLKPLAEDLAQINDEDGFNALGKGFHMHNYGGGALSIDDAAFIRRYAAEMAVPIDRFQNFAILNPADFEALGKEMKPLDMPSNLLETAAIRGLFDGEIHFWSVVESVNIPYWETAAINASAAPKVNASGGTQGDTIATDGWGVNSTKVLNDGQIIQIAGVKEVQRRGSHKETGRLASFTVKGDVTTNASGQADIKISPRMNDGTLTVNGAEYKGGKNVSAKAADNAVIQVVGTGLDADGISSAEGTTRRQQSIFFRREALEYVPITLAEIDSAKRKGRAFDEDSGLTLQVVEDFDIKTMESTVRMDIMYGYEVIYPEIGFRHIGAAV